MRYEHIVTAALRHKRRLRNELTHLKGLKNDTGELKTHCC